MKKLVLIFAVTAFSLVNFSCTVDEIEDETQTVEVEDIHATDHGDSCNTGNCPPPPPPPPPGT